MLKPAALPKPNGTSASYVQGRVWSVTAGGHSALTLLPAPSQAYKYGTGSLKALATVRLAEASQVKRDWDGARALLEEVSTLSLALSHVVRTLTSNERPSLARPRGSSQISTAGPRTRPMGRWSWLKASRA